MSRITPQYPASRLILAPMGGGNRHGETDLLKVVPRIATFTERIDDDAMLTQLKEQITEAATIVFIGFAFHPQNMKLIAPDGPTAAKRILGTTYGVSESDREAIHANILDWLKRSSGEVKVELKNVKSAALFDEFWRTLSRP